jgi:hypothetical protein
MSTLVIVLTAAMVAPGNGPKMELGEIAESQRLDLRGEWVGVMKGTKGRLAGFDTFRLRCSDGQIEVMHPQTDQVVIVLTAIDEGDGRFRLDNGRRDFLGIYRQCSDSVILCIRVPDGRPASFWVGDRQHLLTLHRVKPHK